MTEEEEREIREDQTRKILALIWQEDLMPVDDIGRTREFLHRQLSRRFLTNQQEEQQ